jgi:hypothetical protein
MPKTQTGSNLVTYEAPPVSVDDEATALKRNTLVAILNHLEQVLSGGKRFDQLKIWKTYLGIPLFVAETAGELMVYAVEHEDGQPLSECKVSVMFAGVRARGHSEGQQQWDGTNDEALWIGIIRPRCVKHFT